MQKIPTMCPTMQVFKTSSNVYQSQLKIKFEIWEGVVTTQIYIQGFKAYETRYRSYLKKIDRFIQIIFFSFQTLQRGQTCFLGGCSSIKGLSFTV